MPYSAGQYSSQPSSPTYVTRRPRTGTSATVRSRADMYGNASSSSGSGVSGASTSRARGPQIPKHAHAGVTSRT